MLRSVMPHPQRIQASQMQREVSCKSANNKKRKAHECYQAASLPQTIKKGKKTDMLSERGKKNP